jgi:hypothetical protein
VPEEMIRWSGAVENGVAFEVADGGDVAVPDEQPLLLAEGGRVTIGEDASGFYLVTEEGAGLDLLDEADAVGLSARTVRRFQSADQRRLYAVRRGWVAAESAPASKSRGALADPPTSARGFVPFAARELAAEEQEIGLQEIHRLPVGVLDGLRTITVRGQPTDLRVFSTRPLLRTLSATLGSQGAAVLLQDWQPRYLFSARFQTCEIVTDRVLVRVTGRRRLPAMIRAHVLVERAERAVWPAGRRLAVMADSNRLDAAGWLDEPVSNDADAETWLRQHACDEATAIALDLLPAQDPGLNVDHSRVETARQERAWSDLEDRLAQAGTLAVKRGRATIASWGPNYVQLSASQTGLLHAEAVSNEYLRGVDRLNARQRETLRILGWNEPIPAVGASNHWTSWAPHHNPDEVARLLAITLRVVYRAWPAEVGIV